ncbi:structure-specific endonuclease subunit SLX1 homolog [Porites lutea]|uniref:structure-specific endonuclease subunit SLX1 homolog n=1 Tax=Porites lutea TaxID=51062 RepID=UPI003CC6D1A1
MKEMDDCVNNTGDNFYGVYLLYCLNPRYKGRTYIGFTVDPNRRIKQHNGGVQKGGAFRTSGRGPWEMILIVHGFPSDIIALQFEWAWQNPTKSRRLRHVFNKKTKESCVAYRFRVLSAMLNVGPWNRLPLTIRWLKQEYQMEFDVEQQPPTHMPIVYGLLNKKKPKKRNQEECEESKDVCNFKCIECSKRIKDADECLSCISGSCPMKGHLICLAKRFLLDSGESSFLIPVEGDCPLCYCTFLWHDWLKYQNQTEEMSDLNSESPHWAEALRG